MAKKVLIVDIDETILNIEPLFFLKRFKKNYRETNGKIITFPNIKREFYISLRPDAKEFLNEAKKDFRLIAFSVVDKGITIYKLKILGIDKKFEKIYGREDLIDRKKCLKIISEKLNIPINEIIAIDDNPQLFDLQDRVIKINPWFIGSEEGPDELLGSLEKAKLM